MPTPWARISHSCASNRGRGSSQGCSQQTFRAGDWPDFDASAGMARGTGDAGSAVSRSNGDVRGLHAPLLHILEATHPAHVGIGADWDGGGGVAGLEDVSHLPLVTERLLKAGYSKTEFAGMWSGNLPRILGEARSLAASVGKYNK